MLQVQVKRYEQGIPRWKLAQRLGIDPARWTTYERGSRPCPEDIASKVAAILHFPVEGLFSPSALSPESMLDRAKDLMEEMLAQGPIDSASGLSYLLDQGVAERTIRRARVALGVVVGRVGESGRSGGGHWEWRLNA